MSDRVKSELSVTLALTGSKISDIAFEAFLAELAAYLEADVVVALKRLPPGVQVSNLPRGHPRPATRHDGREGSSRMGSTHVEYPARDVSHRPRDVQDVLIGMGGRRAVRMAEMKDLPRLERRFIAGYDGYTLRKEPRPRQWQ